MTAFAKTRRSRHRTIREDKNHGKNKAAVSLTPREIEVLTLLSNGLRTGQIAFQLRLARSTVEFHIRNARLKMKARTREQAVARAVRRGFVSID